MRKLLSPIVLLGLLAACGGHENHDQQVPPPVTTTPTPTPTADVFEAQIATVVASQSDTTDTPPVDDVAPTMPENTEPETVQ